MRKLGVIARFVKIPMDTGLGLPLVRFRPTKKIYEKKTRHQQTNMNHVSCVIILQTAGLSSLLYCWHTHTHTCIYKYQTHHRG